jgi:signal transduction histidine kinase/DNA-binding NarL/FixJ family response regulator
MVRDMRAGFVWRVLSAVAIVFAAGCLAAAVWLWSSESQRVQRQLLERRTAATAVSLAASFADQVGSQLDDIDQSLRSVAEAWHADPSRFDLQAWQKAFVSLAGINQMMLIADSSGAVVQSTVPAAIGIDVSQEPYFRWAQNARTVGMATFLGLPGSNPFAPQWHVAMARRLQRPDGSFGGMVMADYELSALHGLFQDAGLGGQTLVQLVGLKDGRIRATAGAQTGQPNQSIADTPMYSALAADPNGVWIGHSAPDGLLRIHAFHAIPGRDLAVVVGLWHDGMLAPLGTAIRTEALLALIVTVLASGLAVLAVIGLVLAGRRRIAVDAEAALLEAANAELEEARSRADAKANQLEAALAGMSDGIAMVDSRLCLLEWNHHFPELAGIPPDLLRVGMPMEQILRIQAATGQFGEVNVEAEVKHRMAMLQSGSIDRTVERQRPDGRTIELRRDRLPDGGFVTLYRDVTARKQAENALREARAAAEAATAAKSRFVAIVSHEIRSPLGALLNTLRLLGDSNLAPPQLGLLHLARQSGDALFGLINDILDMSSMEAGQLTLRPSVFLLEPVLEGVLEMFRTQAAERGIALRLDAGTDIPAEMYADPGRIRQILINLLSNAVKFGLPDTVELTARRETDQVGRAILRLSVRDRGPLIEAEGRARLFRPFSRLETGGDEPLGSGLGLAICRYLVTLMGGEVDCEPWMAPDGRIGNEFWVRLPLAPVPAGARPAPAAAEELPRLPRTRILLVEDILANQLITATLLRREGHMVDIAGSGPAALDAVARQPYDAVLMDIYMPGMGGLAVARQIRALPGAAGRVPIIALTANVGADERLECQRAGMNDLLSKPAVLQDLLAALARHVWAGAPVRPASMRQAHRLHTAPVLATDRIAELRDLLPSDALTSMVEECLADLQGRLPLLRRALQEDTAEAATAQAHAMVGMAAGYGLAALEARLRALMQAARSADRVAAGGLADQLEDDLAHAAEALRQALQIELV